MRVENTGNGNFWFGGTVSWYKHPSFPEGFNPKGWTQGILFVGEKGQLAVDYDKLQLLPQSKFADFTLPKSFTPRSNAHHAEWIRACKTGSPTSCPFEYAGPLAEAVQLGLVAHRVGKRIEWDAANLRARNCPEADRFIRPEYRKAGSCRRSDFSRSTRCLRPLGKGSGFAAIPQAGCHRPECHRRLVRQLDSRIQDRHHRRNSLRPRER